MIYHTIRSVSRGIYESSISSPRARRRALLTFPMYHRPIVASFAANAAVVPSAEYAASCVCVLADTRDASYSYSRCRGGTFPRTLRRLLSDVHIHPILSALVASADLLDCVLSGQPFPRIERPILNHYRDNIQGCKPDSSTNPPHGAGQTPYHKRRTVFSLRHSL